MWKDFHHDIRHQKYLEEWQWIWQQLQLNMKWKVMFILMLLFFGKWWLENFLGLIVTFFFSSSFLFISFIHSILLLFFGKCSKRSSWYWFPSTIRKKRRNPVKWWRSKSWITFSSYHVMLETSSKRKTYFPSNCSQTRSYSLKKKQINNTKDHLRITSASCVIIVIKKLNNQVSIFDSNFYFILWFVCFWNKKSMMKQPTNESINQSKFYNK